MAESTVHLEPVAAQSSRLHRLRASSTALLFLLPAAVLVLVFFVAPVISVIRFLSLHSRPCSTSVQP